MDGRTEQSALHVTNNIIIALMLNNVIRISWMGPVFCCTFYNKRCVLVKIVLVLYPLVMSIMFKIFYIHVLLKY